MAFNPFHSFRKHQKAIMVVVTVVIMFIFVLSYGGRGDFFDQMAALFGAGKGPKKQTVITLYGKKVTDEDLYRLREQRQLVNAFMVNAIAEGQRERIKSLRKKVDILPEGRKFVYDIPLRTLDILASPILNQQEQMQRQQLLQSFFQNFENTLQMLKPPAGSPAEETDIAYQIAMMMHQRLWLASPSFLYFGGSIQVDELLDFMVWKQQADKLGIKLADADFRAEVNRHTLSNDTLRGDPQKDAQTVAKYLVAARYAQEKAITMTDEVLAGLREEIRVNIAQSAILGRSLSMVGELSQIFGVNSIPSATTPDQLFDYFQKNCASLGRVTFLPIPVKNFAGQVKDTPSDMELRALFREFRDREPNPEGETPGFRQPPRIQATWVSARHDSPHYQKLADQHNRLLMEMAALFPNNPAPAVWLTGQLLRQHQEIRNNHRQAAFTESNFTLPYLSTAMYESPNLLTALQMGGALATLGTPLQVVVSYPSAVIVRATNEMSQPDRAKELEILLAQERRERAARAAGVVLGGNLAVGSVGAYLLYGDEERYLPVQALTRKLQERGKKSVARALVRDTLDKVSKEVEGFKNKSSDESAAQLKKLVAEHDLKTGGTSRVRDQFDIDEDEGLKPIKEAMGEGQIKPRRVAAQNFFPHLFNRDPRFQMPPLAPFSPRPESKGDEEFFRYWKTEENDAKTFPSYDEAPDEIKGWVKQAWQLRKAREKARQVRDETAEAARKFNNYADAVRYLRDEGKKHDWGTAFDLTDVAPMVLNKAMIPQPGRSRNYEAYRLPSEKEDLITPRADFASHLVKELKKSGDVTSVANVPETIYYVGVLDWREDEKMLEKDFVDLYSKSSSAPDDPIHAFMRPQRLLQNYEMEQRGKYVRGVMDQLRSDAGATTDIGMWKIDAEMRKRLDSRSSDEG